jgi:hypothetical protein
MQRTCPVLGRWGRVAADRLSEVADPGAQRPAHLRKALRAEDEQRDHENEQEVSGLQDVADH